MAIALKRLFLERYPWLIAVLLFLIALAAGIHANHYRIDTMLTHRSDPWGYYQYLAATLGTHEWLELPWAHTLENGNHLCMFTIGVAYLMAPFFYATAGIAAMLGQPVTGYSASFYYGQFIGSAFYLAAGGHLLFHALRRRFPVRVAIVVPLILFGASNLYFYTVMEPGMSHVYSFFLFAWMHYLTVRMLERPRADRLFALFICAGLLVLVRQLNAVALLFPLLYGSPIREALELRWNWLKRYPKATVAGVAGAALLITPQLIYWKAVTGSLLVFTYGKKDESFNWTDPHLLDVLVSHQNGWWVYTPIMLITTAILLYGAARKIMGMRLLLVVLALTWYTYASWWSWWLGGGFGHRGFIELYALLSIPLAIGMQHVMRQRILVKVLCIGVLAVLIVLNIRMTYLYHWPWEGPEWTWEKLLVVWRTALIG